ncbi:MAG: MerR family transcriptional regulator [Spirochaetaceae bacterium]
MYSIGEFSKINRITTKTLRHYDKIGLLKPNRTDDWTGYRYYSPDQLVVIRKILMLKDLGFSLLEIEELISGTKPFKQSLEQKILKLEEQVIQSQSRLSSAVNYLKSLNKGEVMDREVVIKSLPEVIVASMRTVVPNYASYFDIVPKMGEYMTSVGAVCSEPAYCFTIYHDGEYKEADIDVEVCEAVTKHCKESDKVKFKQIDSVKKAACLGHKGPYKTIEQSYSQVFEWINANGYKVADNPRESYIDGIWNKENPEDWLTEIQIPLV